MRLRRTSTGPRQPRTQNQTNRTPTFSYRANRLPVEDVRGGERNKPQRVRITFRWQHVPTYLIGIVLVVSVIYSVTLSTNPRLVVKNDRYSSLLHNQAVYQEAAAKALSDNLMSRTKITFDSSDFDKRMKQQFPELTATAVTLPLMGRRPVVEVVVGQPALVIRSSSGQFLLDSTGRVIAKLSMKQLDSLTLPIVDDQGNQSYELGKGGLPSQSVEFITTFITELAQDNMKVQSVQLPPTASEAQFKLDSETYYIKTSLQTDVRIAAGSYLALKQKLDSERAKPAEYVDVRVEEKVYYK